MAAANQIKVYRPVGIYYVIPVAALAVFTGVGVSLLASSSQARWSGAVGAVLLVVGVPLLAASIATTSVTTHQQGLVIRNNLRRRFIPWQAVDKISCASSIGILGLYTARLLINVGDKYHRRSAMAYGTTGRKARVQAIIAEMQEFQRGEHQAS